MQLVIKRFCLANLEVLHFLHSVQMILVNLKEDIEANAPKQESLEKIFFSLEEINSWNTMHLSNVIQSETIIIVEVLEVK